MIFEQNLVIEEKTKFLAMRFEDSSTLNNVRGTQFDSY